MGRGRIEPLVIHLACFVTTALQAATRSTTRATGTGGSRTRSHEGLSFAALPICIPCRQSLSPLRSGTPVARARLNVPDGIRTHDLRLDRATSTPLLREDKFYRSK